MADPNVERSLKLSRIIHLAMLLSLGFYVAIAVQVVHAQDPTLPPPLPELAAHPFSHYLFIALAIATVMLMAATPLVRAKLMPPRSYGDATPPDLNRALGRLRVAQIVSWAMCEAVAIYGLILTFLSYDLRYTLAFAAVGALAMLAYAPSRRVTEDVARVASAANG